MLATKQPLTNVQQELMKIYSCNIKDSELNEVKQTLENFFSTRSINNADEIWNEKDFNDNTMDEWLSE